MKKIVFAVCVLLAASAGSAHAQMGTCPTTCPPPQGYYHSGAQAQVYVEYNSGSVYPNYNYGNNSVFQPNYRNIGRVTDYSRSYGKMPMSQYLENGRRAEQMHQQQNMHRRPTYQNYNNNYNQGTYRAPRRW